MTNALERFIGRTTDNLTFKEQVELRGKWVAVEIYTPRTLPFRTFEAVAESAAECRRVLQARGLDPVQYEYIRLN